MYVQPQQLHTCVAGAALPPHTSTVIHHSVQPLLPQPFQLLLSQWWSSARARPAAPCQRNTLPTPRPQQPSKLTLAKAMHAGRFPALWWSTGPGDSCIVAAAAAAAAAGGGGGGTAGTARALGKCCQRKLLQVRTQHEMPSEVVFVTLS